MAPGEAIEGTASGKMAGDGASSAVASAVSLSGFGIAEDHGQRKQEQDEPACDLKGRQADAERIDQELSGHQEKQKHTSGDERGLDRDPAMRGGIQCCGDSDEKRDRADRIDDHPECYKLLENTGCHSTTHG
jgi:hypothetical protein